MPAILCDIHGTLLDDNNKPIIPIIEIITRHIGYDILLITAGDYTYTKNLRDLKYLLDSCDINYNELFVAKETYLFKYNYSDDYIKAAIYRTQIQDKHSIVLTIDNNKDCFKMWRKYGLDSLRFGAGKSE